MSFANYVDNEQEGDPEPNDLFKFDLKSQHENKNNLAGISKNVNLVLNV